MRNKSLGYVVGMTVFDREEYGRRNLIRETMRSLRRSGFRDQAPLVLCDGGSRSPAYLDFLKEDATPVELITTGKKVGHPHVGCHLLDYIQSHYFADYVVFLEDDILFAKNWFRNLDAWLSKRQQQDVWAYSFYTPYIEANEIVWEYPTRMFYGLQCLALRFDVIRDLVEFTRTHRKDRMFDMAVKRWLLKRGQEKLLASCPSLVQHMNTDSTYVNHPHTAPYWDGEDDDPCF